MHVIKDEMGHFEEKFGKIIKIFQTSDPDLDPVQLFWIRIRI
jgi:hypothetical protein